MTDKTTPLKPDQLAVLKRLAELPTGMTGPECFQIAMRFGTSSGRFEWGRKRLLALTKAGYARLTDEKRNMARVFLVTAEGTARLAAEAAMNGET